MANVTITNLPSVTGLSGSEPLLGVQSGTSVQITTGQIVSLATGGGGISPLSVIGGGTGDTTLTAYGLLYGNGTAPIGSISPPAGTNYILVGSSGSAPTWQPTIPVTAGVDSINTGTTGLLVGNTSGQSPIGNTDVSGVVTLSGVLNAVNGGTGQSSYTVGDLLYASSTTALSKLAAVAAGSVLVSAGTGTAPAYSASPTLTTSLTTPLVIGGTAASSTLTLESTSGAGTTDAILFKTGSQSERMRIDTSGNVSIGSSGTTTGVNLLTNANITGATTAYAHQNSGVVQSAVTSAAYPYYSSVSLAASVTTSSLYHNYVNPAAGGAGSTVTTHVGYFAESTIGTQGAATVTSASGFYGNLASGTSRWNLYMAGTAPNYMAGNLGIGTTYVTNANLNIGANIGGSTTAYALYLNGQVQSAVNSTAYYISTQSNLNASTNLQYVTHYSAYQGTISGTIAQSQVGFYADSGLTAGTTLNLGFQGSLSVSGTKNWNLYMNGSAPNYLAGSLGVGTSTVGSVAGSINAVGAITFQTTTNNQSYTTTGAGTITISSGTAGTIDNMAIGATTRSTGAFTTLGANGAVTIQTTTNSQSYTTTGAGTITISSGTAGTINNMSIGGTTAAAGTFTTTTSPTVAGGTTASSVLTLESTSGAGTTDSIQFLTASQSEAARYDTTGAYFFKRVANAVNATATLTVAQLRGGIITSTTGAAVTMTMPTGTVLDTAGTGLAATTLPTNATIQFTIKNTGATNAITVAVATGVTNGGVAADLTIAASATATYLLNKTATNTFVLYKQ